MKRKYIKPSIRVVKAVSPTKLEVVNAKSLHKSPSTIE